MATEAELLNELKLNPLVLHVSEAKESNQNGLKVHRYQILVGSSDLSSIQNLQMAIVDGSAYWIGSIVLPEYAGSKSKVIEHLYSLQPKPIAARERFSSYEKLNQFTIVDCYYEDGSRKSRLARADGEGNIVSTELLELYQGSAM